MDFLEKLKNGLTGQQVRVVFPEGTEPRILAAVEKTMAHGFLKPILLGAETAVQKAARENGIDLTGAEIIDPAASDLLERYIEICCKDLKIPSAAIAKVFLSKPNNFGAMMLRTGAADTFISGSVTATSEVIAANKLIVGFAEDHSLVSGLMLLDIPARQGGEQRILAVADPAINIAPTPEDLADIAIASAATTQALMGYEPRVAMLSFSTHGSGAHPKVDAVVQATKLVKSRAPELKVDGELQADAAIVPAVAQVKIPDGPGDVAGRANVLIFPELNASNIGVKLIQWIGGADAYGIVVQGLKKPLCDLSRGATIEDIIGMITIMAAIASKSEQS